MAKKQTAAGVQTAELTKEQTRVVTVRMPESLHTKLSEGAHDRRMSMNIFCLQAIEQGLAEPVSETPITPLTNETSTENAGAAAGESAH